MTTKIADSVEFNFDGLVGPSHNYAGLSYGNIASAAHQNSLSHPRAAAWQGLDKMERVAGLGAGQALLPPLPRPRLRMLRELGFTGKPAELVSAAQKTDPRLLAACYSASNMWTANAATVSPAADSRDGRLHLTPANLGSLLHRSLEADQTSAVLQAIFGDPSRFHVHGPLPTSAALMDEGAANHTRFCGAWGEPGVELFVYGREALRSDAEQPRRFPARQTREACAAIARRHLLDPDRVCLLQQNPAAIDQGVFHNDVVAVGSGNVLFLHEQAWAQQAAGIRQLSDSFQRVTGRELQVWEVPTAELALEEAIRSYLFNSQLIRRGEQDYVLVCPDDCRRSSATAAVLERLVNDSSCSLQEVIFLDLRQSMNNGGGPACLRLRIVLDPADVAAMAGNLLWTPELNQQLRHWVQEYYRETLHPSELVDPQLLREIADAGAALAQILRLPTELLIDPEWL